MSKVLQPLEQAPVTAGPPQPPVQKITRVIAGGYVPAEERIAAQAGVVPESKILSVPKKDDSLMGGYTGIGSIAKDSREAGRFSKAAQAALDKAKEREERLAKLRRGGGLSEFIDGDTISETNGAAYAFAGLE